MTAEVIEFAASRALRADLQEMRARVYIVQRAVELVRQGERDRNRITAQITAELAVRFPLAISAGGTAGAA